MKSKAEIEADFDRFEAEIEAREKAIKAFAEQHRDQVIGMPVLERFTRGPEFVVVHEDKDGWRISRFEGTLARPRAATGHTYRKDFETALHDAVRDYHGDLSRAEITENRGHAMTESTMKSKKKKEDLRQLGADHAQEQLDSDYFNDWVREQLFEGEQMRRRDPSSVIPFDANVIAKNMLQQLVWDTKRDLRIADVVGRDVSREEANEFMSGFEETAKSDATRSWLADEILQQTEEAGVSEMREASHSANPPTWIPPSLANEGLTIPMLEVLLDGVGDGSRIHPGKNIVYDRDGYTPLREGGYIVLRRATPGLSAFGDFYVLTDKGAAMLRRYRLEVRKIAGGGKMRESWQPGGARIMMESPSSKAKARREEIDPSQPLNTDAVAYFDIDGDPESIALRRGQVPTQEVMRYLTGRRLSGASAQPGSRPWEIVVNFTRYDGVHGSFTTSVKVKPRKTSLHEEWQPGGTSIAMEDRSHLPRSQVSLESYEREVLKRLRYIGVPNLTTRSTPIGEEARMLILNGWRQGRKPFSTATEIERAWRESSKR